MWEKNGEKTKINESSNDRNYIKGYSNKRSDPRLYSYNTLKQQSENDNSIFRIVMFLKLIQLKMKVVYLWLKNLKII